MGLFKKIKKTVKRVTVGVATGGLSEVARATGHGDIAKTLTKAFVPTSLPDVVKTASIVAAPFTGGASLVAGSTLSANTTGSTGGIPMGIGNVLGGISGLLGSAQNFGGPVGQVAQLGSGFLSGFLPAQGPMVSQSFQQPVLTASRESSFGVNQMTGAVNAFVQPILLTMSQFLGKSITLRAAMIIIRRLGKMLGAPNLVAAAVGLTVTQLSSLITANAIKGSSGRRMNPANVKALRRAHRRIKSFHKLCGDNDRLKAPRRRSAGSKTILVSGKRCD